MENFQNKMIECLQKGTFREMTFRRGNPRAKKTVARIRKGKAKFDCGCIGCPLMLYPDMLAIG
jgi:hypothetical protein